MKRLLEKGAEIKAEKKNAKAATEDKAVRK